MVMKIVLLFAWALQEKPEQESPKLQEPERPKTLVVTATRTGRPSDDTTVPTRVITAEDLATMNAQNVGEALRRIPGLSFQSQGGMPGSRTEILSQGLPAKQLLVLVDGQRVRGAHAGAIDLSEIPLEQIERIEVVQGAASALWGSDAMAGVVNVITKAPPKGASMNGSASVLAGSEKTFIERAAYSAREGNGGAVIGGSRSDTEGLSKSFEYGGTAGFAKLTWSLGEYGLATLQGSAYDEVFPDSGRRKWSAQASWDLPVGSAAAFRATFREFRLEQASDEVIVIPLAFDSDEREDEIEAQFDVFAVKQNALTLGGSWREETIDANTFPDEKSQSFGGFFLQDEITLFDGRVVAVAGFRIDDYSRAGTEFNPKGGIRLRPTDTTIVRASIGRGYKAPQLSDRFIAFDHGFAILQGNPDLEPEIGVGWQIGAEQRLADTVALGLNYFRNEVKDLIEFNQFLGGVVIPGRGFVPILGSRNIAHAWTQGIEGSLSLTLSEAWSAGASYTFLEAENDDTGTDLELRPKHTAVGWVGLDLKEAGLTVTLEGRFVDERMFTRRIGATTVKDRLGDYAVLNLKAGHRVWKDVRATLLVNNILDRDYEELPGVEMPGINFLAGIEARF